MLEAAVDLPSVIYNSPYYGFQTRAELFFELRRSSAHLVGFKEFGGAASLSYAAEHIAGASPDISLLVGVDTQVFHGFVNCGAVGAITGIGNVLPKETLHLVSLCQSAAKGDPEARRLALELDGALATLSAFDEGTDLVLFFKHLMVLRGDPANRKFAVFHLRDGAVAAVEAVNAAPEYMIGKKLVADGKQIAAETLADTSIPMKQMA